MELLVFIILLFALDIAANLWGYDSRDKQRKSHWLCYEREEDLPSTIHSSRQVTLAPLAVQSEDTRSRSNTHRMPGSAPGYC
jgi:hypothetical protein